MNRRQFLASLGIGAPAAVLATKTGLAERAIKYFFAPRGGWKRFLAADWGFDHPEAVYLAGMDIAAQSPRSAVFIRGIENPYIPDWYVAKIIDAMNRDSILFEKLRIRDATSLTVERYLDLGKLA